MTCSFLQYHAGTIKNIREACESFEPGSIQYRPIGIALDTKGPEIRTGLIKGVSLAPLSVFRHVALNGLIKTLSMKTNPKDKLCLLMIWQSGTAEVELKKGDMIKITLDDAYQDNCSDEILWLDYKNITKVVEVGSKVYIDDGLISLQVREIGE